jgi:hypothetical protein
MDSNKQNEIKAIIQNHLEFDKKHLEFNAVSKLTPEQIKQVSGYITPTFCFENALTSAKLLGAKSVVYGSAYFKYNNKWEPLEHAWIRFDNDLYFDPTYQTISERMGAELEVEYFKLFEIRVEDYIEVSLKLGHQYGNIIAMDFAWFRNSPLYKQYFI